MGLAENLFSTSISTPVTSVSTTTTAATDITKPELPDEKLGRDVLFTASVAELRRKAQEHSAALWQSLQQQIHGESTSPELSVCPSAEIVKSIEKVPEDSSL